MQWSGIEQDGHGETDSAPKHGVQRPWEGRRKLEQCVATVFSTAGTACYRCFQSVLAVLISLLLLLLLLVGQELDIARYPVSRARTEYRQLWCILASALHMYPPQIYCIAGVLTVLVLLLFFLLARITLQG